MTLGTEIKSTRSGRFVRQPGGYSAFIPRPLPPDPPLQIDDEFLDLLSKADQALGRLDTSADILPNPDLFVGMYARKEAVLSSQIEGTQASLTDVLEYEALRARRRQSYDIADVVNYVNAMNHGLRRLTQLPLSHRLLREVHGELLMGVRGQERRPGEFRTSQNWISGDGRGVSDAIFVPPPPVEVGQAMGDVEAYIHGNAVVPLLVKAGLIHSQLETVHPFLDGNGRMGRLLITLFLCEQGALKRPILYLSAYFKQHRQEYYARLQAVRELGHWEEWLKFFLRAVFEVSREASDTVRQILVMREGHRQALRSAVPGSARGIEMLDYLFQEPYITISRASELLGVSYPTASALINTLSGLDLLTEVTGQRRGRVFRYDPYLQMLEKGTEVPRPAAA